MTVEASEIVPGLWQGSKPALGPHVAERGFDVLVLCAREYQPASVYFPKVQVIHAPNDDNPALYPFTEESLKTAVQASTAVLEARREGKRCLVTCAAGMNRSGLVVAITLHRLYGWSGDVCISKVRNRRRPRKGYRPLSNPDFTQALRRLTGHIELPGMNLSYV